LKVENKSTLARITGANRVLENQHNYYNDTPDGCLRTLGASDPRVEKDRIEVDKDMLLKQ